MPSKKSRQDLDAATIAALREERRRVIAGVMEARESISDLDAATIAALREEWASRVFKLTFWGGAEGRHHTRYHLSLEAAREEAERLLADFANRAVHPALIYGPGLGFEGATVR